MKVSTSQTDIDVNYTLKPKGFPFKAGYIVDNVSLNFIEKETLHRAKLSTNGYNFIYISVFDLYKPLIGENILFNTVIEDFEGVVKVESSKEKVEVRFNIARSIGKGSLGKTNNYTGNLSDLDVYVTSDDIQNQRILTVNQFKLNNLHEMTSRTLNASSDIDVTGATFYDLKGDDSFEVDRFNFGFNVENMPILNKEILDLFAGIDLEDFNAEKRESLKNSVLGLLQNMHDSGTEIELKDYRLQIGEFTGNLLFNFRVNNDLKPVGKAVVKMENFAALNHIPGLDEAPVDVNQFTPEGAEAIELILESDGKKVFFNGFPILLTMPATSKILDYYFSMIETSSNTLKTFETPVVDKTEILKLDTMEADVSAELPASVDVSESVSASQVLDDTPETISTTEIIVLDDVSITVDEQALDVSPSMGVESDIDDVSVTESSSVTISVSPTLDITNTTTF